MKLLTRKYEYLFILILLIAVAAYLYSTSPMLNFIKFIGCILSALLFAIAMQARVCKRIDTTQLGADWALLFTGACGLSFIVFFYDLSEGYISTKAWLALITGLLCHVLGLACWYGQNLLNNHRKNHTAK